MEIPHEIAPIAYAIARRVYKGELTSTEGKRQLVGDDRMKSNSAAVYINDFRCMVEGILFTRTINAYSMEYFVKHIYKDYGASGLSNALTALKLHIEYYEGIQETNLRLHKMREIYEKYLPSASIDTPDDTQQNEIVQELRNNNTSRQELITDLLNLKPSASETIIIKSKVFKRDNKTVAQIKLLRDFKCQICNTTIRKKDGSFYVEAAHIVPKHQRGPETPDNILLLCPNHHKEFDLGETTIHKHDTKIIEITLNGHQHTLSLEIK
jgi:5-methylcytosine-specific restriction protein A